jgi:hypothetical protein
MIESVEYAFGCVLCGWHSEQTEALFKTKTKLLDIQPAADW